MKQKSNLEILQLIRNYNMPVGATFLGEQLGLPQATVGRILLTLEQKGLLEKVSNKGRRLTSQGMDYVSQQEQLHDKLNAAKSIIETAESGSKKKLYKILEIRLALEALSAERACTNASPEDLQQLDAIMLEYLHELKRGGIGSEQDLQLHLKIAEASGNDTLEQMLRLILTQEKAYTKFSMMSPHFTNILIKQHSDIVEAIRNKDAQHAREAMVAHLNHVMEDVRLYYHD